MYTSNEMLAAATKPYLAELGQLIQAHSRAFDQATGVADSFDSALSPATPIYTPYSQHTTHEIFVQCRGNEDTDVQAHLHFSHPAPIAPFGAHNQRLGNASLRFIPGNTRHEPTDVRYAMFTTGHVAMSAAVHPLPQTPFDAYLRSTWSRLALDPIAPLPTTETDMSARQVGPGQVKALGEYLMGLLPIIP